jgi:hypothetical protein
LEHSSSTSSKRKRIKSEEQQQQQQGKPHETNRSAANGFVLPDLNIPAQDIADGSVVAAP